MNFLQRSTHLYLWIAIAIILAVGFALAGWAAFRNPYQEDTSTMPSFAPVQVLDSLYEKQIDTHFWLKKNDREQYLEAQVMSEQPFISIQVFQDSTHLGTLKGKGIYTLTSSGDSIGELTFKRLLD